MYMQTEKGKNAYTNGKKKKGDESEKRKKRDEN